ncbi:MAG: hypothetical protein ACE5NN_00605 [Candidatus Bathyarchaeia archaeon]
MSTRASLSRFSIVLISLILLSLCFSGTIVRGEAADQDSIKVRIDRLVQIELDGAVIIEDSVKLSTNMSEGSSALTHFVAGLPARLQKSIFYLSAYDALGELSLKRGVDLDGFYGVDVRFRRPIDLVEEGPYQFTVVYVLSELVSFELEFNVSFPLYPILGEDTEYYNLTVILPARTRSVASSPGFTNKTTTIGVYTHQILNRTESNIPPLTNVTSWITFEHSGSPELFLLLELNQLTREIRLDPWGNLQVSDFHQFINRGKRLSTISLFVPKDADDISVLDVYGLLKIGDKVNVDSVKRVSVDLEWNNREALNRDDKIKLTINYKLPLNKYVEQNSFEDYTLTTDFLNLINRTANNVAVKVVLPEGAKVQTPENSSENIYLSEFTNVTRFHNLNFSLKYRYNIFWSSFRPVAWSGISSALLCAILFLLRGRAKPTLIAITPVPPDVLKRFVNSYEERMRIMRRLRSIERQVRRGKLSRRRYRVRRTSLENRLRKLHKQLTDLRLEIAAGGRVYVDLMERLEVAETELETLEGDIRTVEARYRRGELSSEVRHRLLDQYSSRRDRAENTISEVILRLREELR